jgi:hypothetical protein
MMLSEMVRDTVSLIRLIVRSTIFWRFVARSATSLKASSHKVIFK